MAMRLVQNVKPCLVFKEQADLVCNCVLWDRLRPVLIKYAYISDPSCKSQCKIFTIAELKQGTSTESIAP